MIDIKLLRENIDAVKEALQKRGVNVNADKLLEIDEKKRHLIQEVEALRAQRNEISKQKGKPLDIKKAKNIKEKLKTKEEELQKAKNPHLDTLEELKDVVIEEIDMDGINKLEKLITHQNYWVKLLTKKDSFIRKALLTKNLKFLNQRLQGYLSALGLPHRVEFTHEMTANITQFGRELDFGNLSSGQKARVNLGLSFSFRDVLQKSHDSVNVCMLDEVLDVGLDSVGVQNAARMLKLKAREEKLALYIISHRDEVSSIFDRKMTIQMENGFSTLKLEG